MAGPRGGDDGWPPDLDYPRVLLVVLVITVAVAGVWAASTSASAFGAYNPAWDGASDLETEAAAAGAEPAVITATTAYGDVDPNGTVAVVLSPDEPYGDAEAARLRRFVREGGRLVVADDFGPHSNALLADLGVGVRIDGRLVRDEREHFRSPSLIVAPNVADAPLTRNVPALTLNHGSVLRPGEARVLVETSRYAYLDKNRNGDLDDAETMARRPVVAIERVGEGQVVVASDPSLFVNAMLERPGNRAFVRALFSDRPDVLLDYSHAGGVPPLSAVVLALRRTPWLLATVGIGCVGIVVAVGTSLDRIRSWLDEDRVVEYRPSRERLRRGVAARAPTEVGENAERAVAALIKDEDLSDEDE